MKKTNKKGFTIVELVIVIAVIAILAAVLIPTFSSIVKKADESAMLQEVSAARTILISEENAQLDYDNYTYYFAYVNDEGAVEKWYKLDNGELDESTAPASLVAGAKDVVYVKEPQTIVTDATTITKLNEDISENVIIWKQYNDPAATSVATA